MTPQRVSVKFFAAENPRAALDLQPAIGMFHRMIQERALPGLLIDVANYAHVPDGPGIVLIGHEADYGIDLSGGRVGLLATRKRCGELPLANALRDLMERALLALRAVEADGATGLRFETRSAELRFPDRLAAPNTGAAYETACKAVEPLAAQLYGAGAFQLARVDAEDARKLLGIRVSAPAAPGPDGLLERLRAAA